MTRQEIYELLKEHSYEEVLDIINKSKEKKNDNLPTTQW